MDRKFVATCGGAVPTTANGRVVPTATTEDVRPKEMGRYRKVMSLGDKQGWSLCQGGLAEGSKMGELSTWY